MIPVNLETDARIFPARYAQRTQEKRPSPRTLAEAVELAVDQVDMSRLNPVATPEAGLGFQARTLLGLLTFCYARQVYSSNKIAAQLGRELKFFCHNAIGLPDGLILQRFRSENRGPLAYCLKSALLFLAEEKIRQGIVTRVRRAHVYQEAERRIIMAMFTDSLEADNDPWSRSNPVSELQLATTEGID